ncbi:MAG: SAM-dependent methyltransferase [Xanthobacteraceae bacterium]|nr:SAM-dependent methyltransferase [Xanthobacteraceae bacterium]
MTPDLPPDLRAALDRLAAGVSRKDLAARAVAQSQHYRAGGSSQEIIRSRDDALAYAFARMPATYAAAITAFDALREVCALAPRSLLDVGAGPGTAAFAATQAFPSLADIRLVESNAEMRMLGTALRAHAKQPALRAAPYVAMPAGDTDAPAADLVTASYVAGEVAPAERAALTRTLWAATAQALVMIEPGTPAGYERLIEMRRLLIGEGAYVAAPCPHENACPLTAPDWCHFARRLPRSRDHLQVKGATVPFEDEKFSYVTLVRALPRRIDARVLAPPAVTKAAVTAKLCTADGIVHDIAARRDGAIYRRNKSWRWGDAVERRDERSGDERPTD